jgi:hypothetical protein
MTTLAANQHVPARAADAPGATPRPRAIYIWAVIGGAMVAFQLWIWVTWLASGPESITRFRDSSRASWWWAQIFQWGLLAVTAIAVVAVVRGVRRQRQLTTDAMLMIGIFSIWWQDPLYNYLRPGFFYNSNLINLESWVPHIPGVVAPYGNLQPEPVLWGFSIYLAVMFIQVMFMCWVLRYCRGRWPHLRGLALFGIVAVLGFVMDFDIEVPMIRTRMYAYPAGWHHLALWGNSPFQLPVLHFAEGAMFFAACAALRFFRDDQGLTAVERGAGAIQSQRLRTSARALAIVGFVNVISLAYAPLVQLQIAHSDAFPKGFEPQQINGLCGNQGQPYGPCPGPGVPWAVQQGPIPHPSEIYKQFPYFQTPAGKGR